MYLRTSYTLDSQLNCLHAILNSLFHGVVNIYHKCFYRGGGWGGI